jgi:hypothetical protein
MNEGISIIVPIGVFPFFAKACLHNVLETCGTTNIDFVFLHNHGIPDNMQQAFDELRHEGMKFRVVECAFDADECHTMLLDWIIRNDPSLREWIIVQHCDLFWQRNNWLKVILESIQAHPDCIALTPNDLKLVRWKDGRELVTLHDFFGVYNKNRIIQNNLLFQWGPYCLLPISHEVRKIVDNQEVTFKENIIFHDQFLDGTVMMSLECAVRFPNLVHYLPADFTNRKCFYQHWWDFFRFAHCVKIEGSNLLIGRRSQSMGHYSYVSSFICSGETFHAKQYFDRKHAFVPLPWSIWTKLPFVDQTHIKQAERACKPLLRYAALDPIKNGRMGITNVTLRGMPMPLNNIPYL